MPRTPFAACVERIVDTTTAEMKDRKTGGGVRRTRGRENARYFSALSPKYILPSS